MTQFVSFNYPILRQCIHHISFNQFEKKSDEFVPVLPDGMTELVINLGSNYERYSGHSNQINKITQSHLIGIKSKHAMVKPTENMRLINIRFKPACLQYFINEDATAHLDKVIDANLLFGSSIHELEEQLHGETNPIRSVECIENFLISKYRPDKKTDGICKMIDSIYRNPAKIELKQLLEHSSDYKSLERLFQSKLGLNPKFFLRLVQFNYAISNMQLKAEQALTEIAYQSGYFDQSHFNRSFKKFTGMSPKEYLANEEPMLLNNDLIIQSMFIG